MCFFISFENKNRFILKLKYIKKKNPDKKKKNDRYARGILVYGVAGLETFFSKIRSLFVNFHKTKKCITK